MSISCPDARWACVSSSPTVGEEETQYRPSALGASGQVDIINSNTKSCTSMLYARRCNILVYFNRTFIQKQYNSLFLNASIVIILQQLKYIKYNTVSVRT